MLNNKLKDSEIIKALEDWIKYYDGDGSYAHFKTLENAFDLINRLQADNEILNKETKDKERAYNDEFCLRKEWKTKCQELLEEKQIAKAEAIEEFAERLKNSFFDNGYESPDVDFDYFVDNLIKEIVGENND